MAQTKTVTRPAKGGMVTAKNLSDISVPLGLILAKKGLESIMNKKPTTPKKSPKSTPKKGGMLTADQATKLSVPLGLVLAKKGLETFVSKKSATASKTPAKKATATKKPSAKRGGGEMPPVVNPFTASNVLGGGKKGGKKYTKK